MKNKNTLSKSSKRRDEKVAALNYPPSEDIFNKLTEAKILIQRHQKIRHQMNLEILNGMKRILMKMFQV
jgi:hypothetical protein